MVNTDGSHYFIIYIYTNIVIANMPKKDQQGYYGFDPTGLERAATVILSKH